MAAPTQAILEQMDQPELSPNIQPTSKLEAQPVAPTEAGNPPATGERAPSQPERGREQLANPEQSNAGGAMSLPPVQVPVAPPPPQPVAAQPSQQAAADDNPLIADDVDVIEMEWVNKAKKIINETKNDPHAQEEAVEKLQLDYLKKRYGKEIKKSR